MVNQMTLRIVLRTHVQVSMHIYHCHVGKYGRVVSLRLCYLICINVSCHSFLNDGSMQLM